MIFLNSRKGDMYDFCKVHLQNQIYKKILDKNKYVVEYIHNFDEEITAKSHGSSNIAHYYATTGNLAVVKMIMHYEKINCVLHKDSIFN